MRANEVVPGSKPIFKNPTGYWEHQGSYSVELFPGTPKDRLPSGSIVSGDTVRVQNNDYKDK